MHDQRMDEYMELHYSKGKETRDGSFTIKKLYFSPDYAVHRIKATALSKLFIVDFYPWCSKI
jgi:hypothetical protein